MPIEIRRIEFNEIELRKALALYYARSEGGRNDEANVSAVKIMSGDGSDDFNVVAKVSSTRNDEVIRKVFDHATTVAAFVIYAKLAKIPLPRNASKKLSMTKAGMIALTMRHEHKVKGLDAVWVVGENPAQKSA